MVRDLFDTMMNMVKVSKEEISLANGGNYKRVCMRGHAYGAIPRDYSRHTSVFNCLFILSRFSSLCKLGWSLQWLFVILGVVMILGSQSWVVFLCHKICLCLVATTTFSRLCLMYIPYQPIPCDSAGRESHKPESCTPPVTTAYILISHRFIERRWLRLYSDRCLSYLKLSRICCSTTNERHWSCGRQCTQRDRSQDFFTIYREQSCIGHVLGFRQTREDASLDRVSDALEKRFGFMRSFTLNGKTGSNFQLINDFPAYLCTPIPLRLQFSPFCTQYPQKERVAHWSLRCLAQHT